MQNNETKLAHVYPLKIKTLSPVSIGTGETLSSFIDFLYDRRTKDISFIDQKKLEEILSSKDLVNEFVEETIILKKDNNNKDIPFNLDSFLKDKGIAKKRIVKSKIIKVKGDDKTNVTELYTIIKNAEKPYVAGSSLKGAMNTALLYDWLMNDKIGKSELNNFIQFFNTEFDKLNKDTKLLFKERVKHFDKALKAKREKLYEVKKESKINYKIQKDTQHSNRKSWKQINDKLLQKDHLDPLIEKTNIKFEKIIEKLFGQTSNKEQRMDSSLYRITDSQCFEKSDIAIYDTKRFHLQEKKAIISQVRETIEQDSEQDITLVVDTLKNEVRNEYLQTILSNDEPLASIFNVLNKFALANVEYELKIMKGTKREYTDFLNLCKTKIENTSTSSLLRVGSGKTYFWNSIGLALHNTDKQTFMKLREVFELYPMQDQFPITISITMDNFLPLGWVELCYSRNILKK